MQKNVFENMIEGLIKDLKELVSIPSTQDLASSRKNAPFGEGVRAAFDCFGRLAKEKGFLVEDDEGYAISAQIGEGLDYIGVLGHLDVVEAGNLSLWKTAPFQLHEEDGIVYGRGVNDDKGPLLCALYAAWWIKQQKLPLRYPIRIIAGGAEETSWECMEHYFQGHSQPLYGFSPDGNFPIVNGEKGILQVSFCFPYAKGIKVSSAPKSNYVCDHVQVELSEDMVSTYPHAHAIQHENNKTTLLYKGKTALSRNPQRGENALFAFVRDICKRTDLADSFQHCMQLMNEQFLDDVYGEKSGLFHEDANMGSSSICPMSLISDEEGIKLSVDIRYVRTSSEEDILHRLQQLAKKYHADLQIIRQKKMLYVEEDSELIQALKKAYRRVMHEEAQVLTKGGASYARVLQRGVAFGATFPDEDPHCHMPNEHMSIASMRKACEIYYEALYELAVDKEQMKK